MSSVIDNFKAAISKPFDISKLPSSYIQDELYNVTRGFFSQGLVKYLCTHDPIWISFRLSLLQDDPQALEVEDDFSFVVGEYQFIPTAAFYRRSPDIDSQLKGKVITLRPKKPMSDPFFTALPSVVRHNLPDDPSDVRCYRDEQDQRVIICKDIIMQEEGKNLKLKFLDDSASDYYRCGMHDAHCENFDVIIECDTCDFSINYLDMYDKLECCTLLRKEVIDILICPSHSTTMTYAAVIEVYGVGFEEEIHWEEKQKQALLSCPQCENKVTMKQAFNQTLEANNPLCEHLSHWKSLSSLYRT